MNEYIKKTIPVITFHKVDPSFEWGVTRVTPRQFRKIIKGLADRGYKTASLSQISSGSKSLPEKPVVITFDDAYESIYKYALPIMEEYNFKGTVFVITGFAGGYNIWDVNLGGLRFKHLNWKQIQEIKEAGFEIGSHTVHHSDLTRINSDMINKEITRSKEELEQKLGDKIEFISFPFGRYDDNIVSLCVDAGYKGGCAYWVHDRDKKNSFLIKRKAWYLFDPPYLMSAKLENGFLGRIEEVKLRVINFFSHGTALLKPAIKN